MQYKMNYDLKDDELIDNKLKYRTILNFFQTSATIHAKMLGLGFEDLYNKGYYWVLLKTKFEVVGNIDSIKKVILHTYPKKSGKIDFDRDHRIYDCDGNLLIKGCTKFVVININTRKIARSMEITYPKEHVNLSNFDGFDKLKVSDTDLELLGKYQVLQSDIDENGHMNNVNYANIIDELYQSNKKIKKFQIDYIKEVYLNDIINLYIKKDNDLVYLLGKKDDIISFIVRIEEK